MNEKKNIYKRFANKYQKASKKKKSKILDDFVRFSGLNKKYSATFAKLPVKMNYLSQRHCERSEAISTPTLPWAVSYSRDTTSAGKVVAEIFPISCSNNR
ncbi:MAG: hypothetical protein WHS77_08990 [Brevinematales bacterium]